MTVVGLRFRGTQADKTMEAIETYTEPSKICTKANRLDGIQSNLLES